MAEANGNINARTPSLQERIDIAVGFNRRNEAKETLRLPPLTLRLKISLNVSTITTEPIIEPKIIKAYMRLSGLEPLT
ncbi:MAG TPA: hypothetical protein VEY71_01080, partial [Chitinophagales bacterium]|nr:hypothetical protein [Chitinophagales bacterium]